MPDRFLKVAARCVGLLDALAVEFFVFRLGEFLRHLVRDFSGVGEDVAVVDGEEAVELGDPVAHVHGDTAHGLAFGKDEVLLDEVVQRGEFRLVEVILGDGDVLLAHLRAAPVGQAHVGLLAVGAGVDDLRRRLAGDGPVHLVLHGLEELDAVRLGGVVINAGGVDVGDLLVEPPLGGADVLNPAEQFVEVIEGLVGILEAFVVEDEAFDDELAELLRGPDAEAGGDGAFDAVADGDDGVEVVEIASR